MASSTTIKETVAKSSLSGGISKGVAGIGMIALFIGLTKGQNIVEMVGIGLLGLSLIILSLGGLRTAMSLKGQVEKTKYRLITLSIVILTVILMTEIAAIVMNAIKKSKINMELAELPGGNAYAWSSMIIILIQAAIVSVFFTNVKYYLGPEDSMWMLVSTFLATILMVLILGIYLLRQDTIFKYFITDG